MKQTLLLALALPLLLTQCADTYGPNGGDPYANPYRQDMRDQGAQMNAMAFERGQQDGQEDALRGQTENYQRHSSHFDRNTAMAYRDAYNHRYSETINSRSEAGGYPTQATPLHQPHPTAVQQPGRDPVYNQGYDYGLRDRTGGRVADPAGHVGRYDPRYRSSFERGYYDAYHSSSSGNIPVAGASSWFR